MVDTIVIRVHDLRRHEDLKNEINISFTGTSKNTVYLTKEDTELITNSETIDGKMFIDYFQHLGTKRTHLIRFQSQEKINNSGHYYLHAFVNFDKNYIEFNFSIPKHKFGTNILMFCEHFWNRDFKYYNNSSLDYNLNRSYTRLINFIHNFFKREFILQNIVDFSLVEINRIDLAFNQVFEDKQAALQYLEYQKKIRKKNLRVNSNNFRDYETALMYITNRYSLKIYHKGTEYARNDIKEHKKINKMKGFEYFNIKELQSFADKMLRYEVTFRNSMLSYLYNHKIFRRRCPKHKAKYKIFKKVDSQIQKNDRIAERIGSIRLGFLRDSYVKKHPYIQIDKNELHVYKVISKLLNRNRQFLIETDKDTDDFNKTTSRACFEPRALFSRSLFAECAKYFKAFIKDFQVTKKPAEGSVADRIDEYNSRNFYKLPKNEMLKFYALLHNSSFEELMKRRIYSRATFYRYKGRFAKIGITQNNIMPIDYIHPKIDLGQYHHNIINKKLFNHERF